VLAVALAGKRFAAHSKAMLPPLAACPACGPRVFLVRFRAALPAAAVAPAYLVENMLRGGAAAGAGAVNESLSAPANR